MSQSFGIESQHKPSGAPHRQPARYLVIIESAGTMLARLYLDTRVEVGEFDASSEEVPQMVQQVKPTQDAGGAEWDQALAAHSAAERAKADVYRLEL